MSEDMSTSLYWIMPIVLFNVVMLGFAGLANIKSMPGTSRILIATLGLYWSLSALWVEALLGIWYPTFDYQIPPDIKSDPRPGRYVPYCDISPTIKCSTTLLSPYNRLLAHSGIASPGSFLDFANGSVGIPFYFCHILLVLCTFCTRCEKRQKKGYYYHRYDDEPACGCCSFHLSMFIFTVIKAILAVFHMYKEYVVLREFSFIHCGLYITTFALLPVAFKTVPEEIDEDKKKHT